MPNSMWQYLFDWMPLVVFLGVLALIVRLMRRANPPAVFEQYRNTHIAELRRINDQLERITRLLEQRPPA